jgi:hypothetical protein
MTTDGIVGLVILCGVVALLVYCPIFKPWFGFRRPPGHTGHWFE